jgi:hypothetical protein
MSAQALVQIGMRAAVRDVIEYLDDNTFPQAPPLDENRLRAYLLGLLITAGAYDDLHDGDRVSLARGRHHG